MASVTVPDELAARLERLADEFDGFEDEEALVAFALSEFATELERRDGDAGDEAHTPGDGDVEQRLQDLGYI